MGDTARKPNHRSRRGRLLTPANLLFFRNFLKHPSRIGWLLPSSPRLVNEVLRQVDWDRARLIVEYGPGTGQFTEPVLERMRPDAHLIALEINADFVAYLNGAIKDPRLHLVRESAAQIDAVLARLGFAQADYVISGIPFATLPHQLRDTIVRKTHSVLRPTGRFLVYQLSDSVLPYLEAVFGQVSRGVEILHILPARLYYCSP
jgi:phospholipid N-methyltransferase